MATSRSNAGFTLIELMVGLAVAGILVTIGTSVSTTYSMQRTFHQQVTWFGGQ
jgi:prepilin-type N-terminal cleavage/methylation domain-containing protein